MPSNESSHRFQYCIVWLADGTVDNDGNYLVSTTPVEMRVRWDNVNRQGLNAQNESVTIDASLDVDDPLPIGSAVWQGRLEDLPSPFDGSQIYRVVSIDYTPDVKGREINTDVNLTRSANQLPVTK